MCLDRDMHSGPPIIPIEEELEAVQLLPEDALSVFPALVYSLGFEELEVEDHDYTLEGTLKEFEGCSESPWAINIMKNQAHSSSHGCQSMVTRDTVQYLEFWEFCLWPLCPAGDKLQISAWESYANAHQLQHQFFLPRYMYEYRMLVFSHCRATESEEQWLISTCIMVTIFNSGQHSGLEIDVDNGMEDAHECLMPSLSGHPLQTVMYQPVRRRKNQLRVHQKGQRIKDQTGRKAYWTLSVKKPKISAIQASETCNIMPDMPNQESDQTLISPNKPFIQCTVPFLVLPPSSAPKHKV
ncbi:hypothetical protein ARMGADRAFT_1098961 [Armillaria gallica]|uniref:Uncharacterized protein n=1 Tax=Armillaria gallica TaxID=47427 RepID=A0A2H3E3P1_ARMGA|nr:hypothetical protein ARMGADRAFT_1098961 [Armillaria gallica]